MSKIKMFWGVAKITKVSKPWNPSSLGTPKLQHTEQLLMRKSGKTEEKKKEKMFTIKDMKKKPQ